MSTSWNFRLLGAFRVQRGQEIITRFRSHRFGALLAYLALFPGRSHSREELADLLWPDADPDAARTNLRSALSSLRRQLEPPGTLSGSILVAEGRTRINLNPEAIITDVAEFDAALTAARRAESDQKAGYLLRAVQHYGGPLLPGYYETWALTERDRLEVAYQKTLRQLSSLMEQSGDADDALDYARRATAADPSDEEAHAAVIRLLMASGQTANAKRQFDEMVRLFKDQFDAEPSPETAALLRAPVPSRETRLQVMAPPPPTAMAAVGTSKPDVTATIKSGRQALPVSTSLLHNLPLNTTRFFGRDDEIRALHGWLLSSETRLLTVTGPGGSGKTRTAVEAVRGMEQEFSGGVWFVPLADLREAERIPDAIADALGLTSQAANRKPLLDQIADTLQIKTSSETDDAAAAAVLLVLDNFEHLAEDGSGIVATLLGKVPQLRCLVTSRQRLRLEQEREFPLLPLPVPEYPGTPERLNEFASVQLFVSRAQSARNDFQLTSRNAAAVAALCAKLEGIPLAIELAAAWSETMAPAQTLRKMEQRLDLLVSRRRDVSPRHRTLRAAIEGSVALLPPDARRFFTALSVFRGGFTLEAVEAILEKPDTPGLLATLRDHSLIVAAMSEDSLADEEDGTLRFRMLETLREYALESAYAEDSGGEAMREVAARHATYFSKLVEEAAPYLSEHQQAQWLRQLEIEHDNIRAALDTLRQARDGTGLLHLTAMLVNLWLTRGHITEGRQRLEAALAQADDAAPAILRARALSGSGKLAHMQGDFDAARALQTESLALYRSEGDQSGISHVLSEMGNREMKQSNYAAAEALYQESLAGFRAIANKKGIALVLNNLGANLIESGRQAEAKPYLEESLPLHRETGHHRMVAVTLLNLGSIAQSQRNLPQARALFEQSLAIRRDLGDSLGMGRALEALGTLALEESNEDEALRRFDESLAIRREIQDRNGIASLCLNRGLTLIYQLNDSEGAAANLSESLNLLRQIGNKRHIAYAVEGMASVAAARNQPEKAVGLWAAAAALRENIRVPREPLEADQLAEELAQIQALLGETRFRRVWTAGQKLSVSEAMDQALHEGRPVS